MHALSLSRSLSALSLGLYVEPVGALIVADLHIGYEEALAEQGIHLPRSQYHKIKRLVSEMLEHLAPEVVVLLGDVKHEFGEATRQEWIEVADLIKFLRASVRELLVVRGNHDNYLIPILKREGVPLFDPTLQLGDVLLAHGHKALDVRGAQPHTIVVGHEHPAIALKDDLGIKYKFKCFLAGELSGKRLVVLPALSPLMPGSEVNVLPKERLLSPILRQAELENFRVFVTDPEVGVYDFGLLKHLEAL